MIWARAWAFLRQVPGWLWIALAVALTWRVSLAQARMDEQRQAKSKQAVELAKETARQERALREASDDLHTSREEADDARERVPVGRSADELREQDPGLADIVFGPGDGSGGARKS